MPALPITDENEDVRQQIVDKLSPDDLRDDATLTRVAKCVEAIYGVSMTHVSLLDRDYQCVVGHVGFDKWQIDREQTFCTRVIARNDVLFVNDATEHPDFEDNPMVTGEPYIRFYVGVPVVVGDVAVGTLCAMDNVPHEPDMEKRIEMFGLVHLLEQALGLRLQHGRDSTEFALARDLVDARAATTLKRYEGALDPNDPELRGAEESIRSAVDRLVQIEDEPATDLDDPTDVDPSIAERHHKK
jgi:transcriptional regulator with GAF, ATPase, and Fis domain